MVDIAKLEKEFADVVVPHKEYTVTTQEGLQLMTQLDEQFRPFLIKYTGLVNKAKQYIPVDPTKLQPFIKHATRLSNCKELSGIGVSYLHALQTVLNGFTNDKAEDAVYTLYYNIQLSDSKGLYELFTIEGRADHIAYTNK